MDTKHHIRIVGFKVISFISKTTNKLEEMRVAQCVVTSESAEKGQQVVVGELVMPKALSDTPPGEYLAEFELAVDKSHRIGARVLRLHPIGQSAGRPGPSQPKEQDKKAA